MLSRTHQQEPISQGKYQRDALWEMRWSSRSEIRRVLVAEEGDSFPRSSGSSGTTNTVDVALYSLGEVCARAISTVFRIRDGWE